MMLVLGSGTDLEKARRLASWRNRASIDQVIVSLPWLDPLERQRTARALTSYFNHCGCVEGTMAFVLVLVVCLWADPWPGTSGLLAIACSFLSALLAAVPAKLIAQLWNRWRLALLLSRIARSEPR